MPASPGSAVRKCSVQTSTLFEYTPMSRTAYDSPELATAFVKGSVENELVQIECIESSDVVAIPIGVLPDLINFLSRVIDTGRRRAFRVPVPHSEELGLTLVIDGVDHVAVAKDLSFIGIGISCRESQYPLKLEDGCRIRIRYGADTIEVEGVVKNCSDRLIGIEFPSCLTGNEPTPPEELRRIVQALQLAYIRRLRAEAG